MHYMIIPILLFENLQGSPHPSAASESSVAISTKVWQDLLAGMLSPLISFTQPVRAMSRVSAMTMDGISESNIEGTRKQEIGRQISHRFTTPMPDLSSPIHPSPGGKAEGCLHCYCCREAGLQGVDGQVRLEGAAQLRADLGAVRAEDTTISRELLTAMKGRIC